VFDRGALGVGWARWRVGLQPDESGNRLLARAKRCMLRSCHPIARSLGMSDRPWGALWWIVVAAVLAILFVVTFFLVEGSMWT